MGGFPALSVQPVQQPDILGTYGRLMQIKNAQMQQQNGSLELQQRQLELQNAAQAQADQQKLTAAYQQSGGDVQQFLNIARQSGVSEQGIAKAQDNLAQAVNVAATADDKKFKMANQQHQMIGDSLAAVNAAAPEDQPAVWAAEHDQLSKSGLFDSQPQQLQQFQTYPGPDGVRQLSAAYKTQDQILAQAKEKREAAAQQATAAHEAADEVPQNIREFQQWQKMSTTDQQAFANYKSQTAPKRAVTIKLPDGTLTAGKSDAQGNLLLGDNTAAPKGSVLLQADTSGQTTPGAPLPPEAQATAQAILEGRMSPPGSFALKTPYWQQIMGEVFKQDPGWNEQRAQLRKNYTLGNGATQINAINTALQHTGVLGDAIDALNNGDVQKLNQIGNAVGVQIGKTPKTTFDTIVGRLGPELASAYAVGTGGERSSIEQGLSTNMSPAQLKTNLSTNVQLLNGKINSLRNQWDQSKGAGMPAFDDRFITPEAKTVIGKWQPQQGASGANAPPVGATHIGVGSVDKKKHYLDASGKDLGLAE